MARRSSRAAAVLIALTLALLTMLGPGLSSAFVSEAAAQDDKGFTIDDAQVTNSSGLAADPARNVYWTANTSGAGGRAFALNNDGAVRGTFEFGARPLDVEALAFAGGRLYVGDIGDKQANRDQITVYHFANPSPGATGGQYRSYDFSYPDGPKDAAAMMVDRQGRIFIVSKGSPGGIYASPAQPSAAGVNKLTKVADAPANVTDATMLRDGRAALRTYQSVLILNPSTWKIAASAELPHQPAGESITQTLDGSGLLVGSKGRGSKVDRVKIPNDLAKVPEGTKDAPGADKPTQAPKPEEEPKQQTPEAVEDSGTSPGRNGTWVALGLALLASLAAAGVVYLRGRGNDLPDDGHEETAVLGRRARSGDTGEIPVVPSSDDSAERQPGSAPSDSAASGPSPEKPRSGQPSAPRSDSQAAAQQQDPGSRWARPRETAGEQTAAPASAPSSQSSDQKSDQNSDQNEDTLIRELVKPQRARPRRAHDVDPGETRDDGDAWSQMVAPDSDTGSDLMPRPGKAGDSDSPK